ncbi:MAG: prepilin-type N-terminal cleavage/methylation domain-containing protein [Candidatus Sumerlaeaceae bacterium]|nr:prepilin-type N-terminal cleavage/methylation domain-containing protein [Candidatus Sumerlaeaceae bacterium]
MPKQSFLNSELRTQNSELRRAFTLIELLIVVAIIAILAAIAVPNFLLAQVRAKVSRAQADQRSLATALEAYAVDHNNKYPAYGNPRDYALFAGEAVVFVPVSVTTPVAYMTSLPADVFPGKRTGLATDNNTPYFYMHNYEVVYLGKSQYEGHVQQHYTSLTGSDRAVMWTVWSFGPDLADNHGIILYDPTNGTVSPGDMMRFGP